MNGDVTGAGWRAPWSADEPVPIDFAFSAVDGPWRHEAETGLAIRDLGLAVPGDVALVGFDDLDWTTLVEPAVTVISQPVAALGRTAGERLLARLRGDEAEPRSIRLHTELIVRGSCGAGR